MYFSLLSFARLLALRSRIDEDPVCKVRERLFCFPFLDCFKVDGRVRGAAEELQVRESEQDERNERGPAMIGVIRTTYDDMQRVEPQW